MFGFIKKHVVLILVTIIIILSSFLKFNNYIQDTSYTDGSHIFDVPLTENLAQSIRNCTPYRVKHSERLFQQFWTNSWGQQDILLVEPQKNGTCRITKKQSNLFAAGSEVEFDVVIPLDLAKKSGEIISVYLHDKREMHNEIKAFNRCISGCLMLDDEYNKYAVDNMFDAGIYYMASNLETYWENWSVNGKKPQIATKEQVLAEEQVCIAAKEKLKRLITSRRFLDKDDFHQAQWMANLVQSDDFYILPGGENNKWDMGFMQPYSACYVSASANGNSQHIFKQIIRNTDPVECKCW